jgi:hypothetical protein
MAAGDFGEDALEERCASSVSAALAVRLIDHAAIAENAADEGSLLVDHLPVAVLIDNVMPPPPHDLLHAADYGSMIGWSMDSR